jgi:hypothetical protein
MNAIIVEYPMSPSSRTIRIPSVFLGVGTHTVIDERSIVFSVGPKVDAPLPISLTLDVIFFEG